MIQVPTSPGGDSQARHAQHRDPVPADLYRASSNLGHLVPAELLRPWPAAAHVTRLLIAKTSVETP